MKLYMLLVLTATAASPLVVAACSLDSQSMLPQGSGQDGGTTPADDGSTPTPKTAGGDAGGRDADRNDGGNKVPPGTLIKQGEVSIQGVTSDGYVVYTLTAGTATSLEIVNVSTKQSNVLSPTFAKNDVVVVDG